LLSHRNRRRISYNGRSSNDDGNRVKMLRESVSSAARSCARPCLRVCARARLRFALSTSDYIVDYRLALDPGHFDSLSTLVSLFSSISRVSLPFSSRTHVRALSTVRSFSRTPQYSCQRTESLSFVSLLDTVRPRAYSIPTFQRSHFSTKCQ